MGTAGEAIYTDATFNGLILAWRASNHYMIEVLSLRQVLDWAIFLINKSKEADVTTIIKAKTEFFYGKF